MRPHTHALKQGRATPPSVRATRRHADGRTQGRNLAYKRLFDTSRPTSRQRQKNTTRGHTRRHSATEGRRATRATTKGHRATTSPAKKDRQERPPTLGRQKTARGHRQTAGDAERAALRHHANALTHHERRRICTRKGATRVVIAAYSIYIYIYISANSFYIIYIYTATALCIFILCAYLLCLYIYSQLCIFMRQCAIISYYLLRMRVPCVCFMYIYSFLCIFIHYAEFMQSCAFLLLILYIYYSRDTLTP